MTEWFTAGPGELALVAVSAAGIYGAVILATRLQGLRSFSKMSAFDFAMTIAVGSVIASTLLSPSPSLVRGVTGVAALFALQRLVAWLRIRGFADDIVDNRPLLLMDGPRMLEDNLRSAMITESDLRAKLREANVIRLRQVRAVVLEATGDISVLHTGDSETALEDALLEGVRREV